MTTREVGAAPTNPQETATKDYVDQAVAGTASPTGSSLARRNSFGQIGVTDPTAPEHATTLRVQRAGSDLELWDRARDHVPESVLSPAQTGQAWTRAGYTSANSDPQAYPIVAGTGNAARFTSQYSANTLLGSFMGRYLDGPVVYVRARWTVNPNTYNGSTTAGTANTGTVGIICSQSDAFANDPSNAVNALCHLAINPTGWTYSVILNKNLITAASGTFATPLAQDGSTIHTCEVVFDRMQDAAYVYLPDNTIRRVSPISNGFLNFDTDLAAATFEIYKINGSVKMPELVEVAADSRRQERVTAARRDWLTAADPDVQILPSVTAATTARPKQLLRCSGTFAVALPDQPPDGSWVEVENTGAGTITVNRSGSSTTFDNAATSITVAAGDYARVYFDRTSNVWYMRRETSLSTAGTGARRDGNGRIQAGDPAANADVVTKGFQDSKALAVLVADVTSSSTASTETILLRATIPANSVAAAAAGRPMKIRLFGYSTSTGTLTFRCRVGSAGTTADSAAWTSTTTAAQAANQRASLDIETVLRASGSSGSILAEGDGTAGTATVGTAVAAPAAVAVNTTAVWYVEVTVVCSVASGFVARMGSIVVN